MYSIFERLLNERGVTVADVCRATGIRQSTMSNWKKRNNNLSAKNAKLVADYFNVSVDYLYGEQEQDSSYDMKKQELFEANLRLDGWTIEHDDPAKGKPCNECPRLQTAWWENPKGTEPGQLCKKCVLGKAKCKISRNNYTFTFSEDDYRSLIRRNNTDSILETLSEESRWYGEPYKIPIVRRVAAGIPLDSIEEIIDWEEVPYRFLYKGRFFGLQIQGDSMEPGIKNGDIVIVRDQPDAEDGQIVVALINGNDGVCKRLKKYPDGTIALMSDNPSYPPMYFNNTEMDTIPIQIKGVVQELRRKI